MGGRKSRRPVRIALVLPTLLAGLVGCSSSKLQPLRSSPAQLEYKTQVYGELRNLPPPEEPLIVAVYRFRDQTGQYKPGTSTTGWSTAVTQGATSMLIKALADAGGGRWFKILERESLPNLLNERKIIRQTRKQYQTESATQLPPLLFAPILLEGGIIAYESNLLTGGLGARYMGIGGYTQYRRDTVTIYLRSVSVKTGQVLRSVTTSKTIFSIELHAGVFKFVTSNFILDLEMGVTSNEPPQMAVQEAIEKSVYAMIVEGTIDGIWAFEDRQTQAEIIRDYLDQKNRELVAVFDEDGNLIAVKTKETIEKEREEAARVAAQRSEPAKGPRPPLLGINREFHCRLTGSGGETAPGFDCVARSYPVRAIQSVVSVGR